LLAKGVKTFLIQIGQKTKIISVDYLKATPYCNENPIYAFPEMKLRGLIPNSYILERFWEYINRSQIRECGN
jgi:hypothetical protein